MQRPRSKPGPFAFSPRNLPADMKTGDLIAAYHGTEYQVLDRHSAVLAAVRVGEASPEFDALLARHGAASGLFITGWNPRSAHVERGLNELAHQRLEGELRARGVRFLPHRGVGADPSWSEEGLFALDLSIGQGIELALAFEQYAIVTVRIGEPARLRLTSLLTG
jgi:hypothetical protein